MTVRIIMPVRRLNTAHSCMIVGSIISMLSEADISSGSSDKDSNQKTGNMTSCRSLNRYSIPSTFLSRILSCNLMSTFIGMEDIGSSQKTELCLSGSGARPYWNWRR